MSLADENEPTRVLFWGEPGTGKSTHMATAAKAGTMHVVDADSGLKARALRDFGIPAENIEPYRDIRYPSLDALGWEIKETLDDDPEAVYALGIDTATEVSDRFLGAIVDKEQGKKIEQAAAKGLDTDDIDPFFRDRSYYGTLAEQFRRLLRTYKDLGIHLAITAHTRRDEDENTGKIQYGPAVSPAVQGHLMGAVDVIAYCWTDGAWPEGYEVAGVKGADVMVADMRRDMTPGHWAKDRFHLTPRLMVNPTFERINAYLTGELTQANDEQQKAYGDLWTSRRDKERETKRAREERKAAARGSGSTAKKTAAKTAAKTTAAKAADGEGDGATPADDD